MHMVFSRRTCFTRILGKVSTDFCWPVKHLVFFSCAQVKSINARSAKVMILSVEDKPVKQAFPAMIR